MRESYQIIPSIETTNENVERFWAAFSRLYKPCFERFKDNKHLKLMAILADQEIVSAEIFGDDEEIKFCINTPKKYNKFVINQLRSTWPTCYIKSIENDYLQFDLDCSSFTQLNLKDHFIYPIKYDPKNPSIKHIMYPFTNLEKGEKAVLQVLVKPENEYKWKRTGRIAQEQIKSQQNPINSSGFMLKILTAMEGILNAISAIGDSVEYSFSKKKSNEKLINYDLKPINSKYNKLADKGFSTTFRIAVQSKNKDLADIKLKEFIHCLDSLTEDNEFVYKAPFSVKKFYIKMIERKDSIFKIYKNILTNKELSQFLLLPELEDEIPRFNRIMIKNTVIPDDLYSGNFPMGYHVTPMGDMKMIHWKTNCIDTLMRPRIYISDPGGGKSEIAENTALDLAQLGYGFCVLDVADGRLVDNILIKICKKREKDIVLIDFNDLLRPPSVDFTEGDIDDRFNFAFVTKMWTDFFIDYFNIESHHLSKNLLRKACALVFSEQGNSLLEVKLMIEDEEFRNNMLQKFENNSRLKRYVNFWKNFNAMPFKVKQETIKPILNKIDTVLDDPRIENILCQRNSKIPPFNKLMDEGKIILIKAGEGVLSYESSRMLGSLIVTKFWTAALKREKQKLEERKPFFMLLDEPQNYIGTTDTAKEAFAKARKYRLCPIMFFQTTQQIDANDKKLLKTLFDLKPHIIFGKQSEYTFKNFSDEIKPLTPFDGSHLPAYHFIAKVYVNKTPVQPFIFKSLWRPDLVTYDRTHLIDEFKRQFGRPVEAVEDDIISREVYKKYDNVIPIERLTKSEMNIGKATKLEEDEECL